MESERLIITVPASSANLGPGFDSIGLAVNRYLTLEVERATSWEFFSRDPELQEIIQDENNLIYEVAHALAAKVGKELPPCRVHMMSDIPLARGLGSSAAAIIAAIELANQLTGASLSEEEKMRFASVWEGHPDNVGPCLYGGLIVGSHTEEDTKIVHCGVPTVELVLAVPSSELLTKKAREVLPQELPFHEAVKGSSISNVLVAAILKDNWELAGEMMTRDIFHQPHRAALIPELTEMIQNMKQYGAYGAALSGAGPTVISFVPKGRGKKVASKLERAYPCFEIELAKPDAFGVQVKKENTRFSSL